MSEIELRPCPFCGSEAELRDDNGEDEGWHIWCPSCRSSGGGYYTNQRDEAIAAWNQRAEQPAATSTPHRSESGVGWGLLKGRIRTKGVPEPSKLGPAFHDALQMATSDDLLWALDLLIKHPNVRRTWRNYRIKHIDARLREIVAGEDTTP